MPVAIKGASIGFQYRMSNLVSFGNFITNLVASLIAYSFQEKKPAIKFETENTKQLELFF
jgi:hypothetical protein